MSKRTTGRPLSPQNSRRPLVDVLDLVNPVSTILTPFSCLFKFFKSHHALNTRGLSACDPMDRRGV